MKSQVELFHQLLLDAGEHSTATTTADWKTISRRIKYEGFEFLTLTLPTFDRDLLASLERGYIGDDLFSSFRKGPGGLPRLFSGFLRHIFDTTGRILPPSPEQIQAIRSVRQLCCFYKKIELDCTEDRINRVLRQYLEIDAEVMEELPSPFTERSRSLLRPFFNYVEKALYDEEFIPRHGPGAVSARLSSNQKWDSRIWSDRLESIFPAYACLTTGPRDFLEGVTWLDEDTEQSLRIVTVPKTMKGPRVIGIEPVYNQYVQQAVLRCFTDALKKRKFRLHNLIFGWTSQDTNREMARLGSISGSYATLDLSEASDRVSLALVRHLFSEHPFLMEALEACRTPSAILPNGEFIHLRKFASMGSALCFPIESLVFTALALEAFEGPGPSYLSENSDNCPILRVFGDDIIVPEDRAVRVMDILSQNGLKVNVSKSFWNQNSRFRESCGADWYLGRRVTPVRSKLPLPHNTQQVPQIQSSIALHNHLFSGGYFRAAEYIEVHLKRRNLAFYADPGSEVDALWTYDSHKVKRRFNPDLHRTEIRCLVFKRVYPSDKLDGYGALRKFFLGRGDEPLPLDHLRTAGRPRHAATYVGWRLP